MSDTSGPQYTLSTRNRAGRPNKFRIHFRNILGFRVASVRRRSLGPANAIFVIYVGPASINEVIVQRLEQDFPVVTEVGKRRFRQGLLRDEVRVFNFWAATAPAD